MFHSLESTKHRLHNLDEALERGEMITSQFFDGQRRVYAAAIQALCDIAMRSMVLEKLSGMEALAREDRARHRP